MKLGSIKHEVLLPEAVEALKKLHMRKISECLPDCVVPVFLSMHIHVPLRAAKNPGHHSKGEIFC